MLWDWDEDKRYKPNIGAVDDGSSFFYFDGRDELRSLSKAELEQVRKTTAWGWAPEFVLGQESDSLKPERFRTRGRAFQCQARCCQQKAISVSLTHKSGTQAWGRPVRRRRVRGGEQGVAIRKRQRKEKHAKETALKETDKANAQEKMDSLALSHVRAEIGRLRSDESAGDKMGTL